MKNKFSTSWKASKMPRKKRKYAANAPLHIKRKFLSANLSKSLREKHKKRSIVLRKNDVVKVMRGKFKGKQGKVLLVNIKLLRIEVEGMQVKKQDGSKVNVPLKPSNLQIVELSLEDKRRLKSNEKITEKSKATSSITSEKPKAHAGKNSSKKSKGEKK